MLYYERNLITTSGFTLDRERQKIHYGKNDHTASILIDRNRCQNGHISLLIVAGEPTWSQLYPPHAGWIRRLDTSRSGFLHTALPAATAHNGNRFKGKTLIKLMWQCLICGCYGVSNRAEPITVFYLRVTGSASKVYVL